MSIPRSAVTFAIAVCAFAALHVGAGRGDPGLVMPSGTPDAVLGEAVSAFVGVPVEVACGGDADSLFLGLTIGRSMWLNEPLVCAPARRFAQGWRPRQERVGSGAGKLAHAILTLTHEAIHETGDASEAHTECAAIQRVPEMVQQLGRD